MAAWDTERDYSTFDVKNALNSAYWPHIIRALENKKVPLYLFKIISNYLSDRR